MKKKGVAGFSDTAFWLLLLFTAAVMLYSYQTHISSANEAQQELLMGKVTPESIKVRDRLNHVSDEQEKTVNNLIVKLTTKYDVPDASNSNGSGCFVPFYGLGLFGLNDKKMKITQNNDKILLEFLNDQGQSVLNKVIDDKQICVVQGLNDKNTPISKILFNKFLMTQLSGKKYGLIFSELYKPYENTDIKEKMYRDLERIEFRENVAGEDSTLYLDGKDSGLTLEAPILYMPDEKRICFIPTKWGNMWCDADSDGNLDNDCLSKPLLDIAKLPQCSENKKIVPKQSDV